MPKDLCTLRRGAERGKPLWGERFLAYGPRTSKMRLSSVRLFLIRDTGT